MKGEFEHLYSKGNDCDACRHQYITGRDGDAWGCERADKNLDCEFVEYNSKVMKEFNGEEVQRVSEKENVIVTTVFNKVSQRYELNFYRLDTGKHWYTKVL